MKMARSVKKNPRRNDLKRSISWAVTSFVLAAVIVAIVAGFVLSLPLWKTSNVQVVGNSLLTEAKVISIANIPIGENIFLIDLDEVRKNFAGMIQIKDVRIKRKLPGTIVIDVKERTPFAVAVIGGGTSLIDDEGYIIAKQNLTTSAAGKDIAKYPVIRGIDKKTLENGNRLNSADRAFIRSALNSFSNASDFGTVQMDISKRDDIVIYIEDILKVKIGDTSGVERKMSVVKALLGSIKDKWTKAVYIDVKVPDSPVIKFK